MSRLRTRLLAAGATLAVTAAVALPATAPAFATSGITFDVVSSTPSADYDNPNIFFVAKFDNLPSSCVEVRPVIDYTLAVTSPSGPVPDEVGVLTELYTGNASSTFWHLWMDLSGTVAEGEVYTLTASSDDPCFGDGQTFSDSATITINGGPVGPGDGDGGDGDGDGEWVYEGEDTLYGVVRVQTVANSTSPGDYTLGSGIEVKLLDADSWNEVDSATTTAGGVFDLTVPVEESSDEDIPYLIVAEVAGDSYYFDYDSSAADPSPTDSDDAHWIYPYDIESEFSYDLYAGTVVRPFETVIAKICEDSDDESAVSQDFSTTYVDWENVCLTDGSISDAELDNLSDAFDDFGYVAFPSTPGAVPGSDDYDEDYFVTADSRTVSTTGGALVVEIVDNDVTAYDTFGDFVQVDVRVTLTIKGSWAKWAVTVNTAGTSSAATTVPFYLVGNLGSDGSTIWSTGSGVYSTTAVSWDDNDGDPILGHRTSSLAGWTYEEGDDDVFVKSTGSLTYEVAVMDWCEGGDPMAEALTLMQSATFGGDIENLGDACPVDVDPSWSITPPAFKVGVAYNQTFWAPDTAPWDWYYGGDIEAWNLPEGLQWEVVNRWGDGAPGLRIFGTPEEAGSYSFGVYLEDDYGNDYEFSVNGTVAPAGATVPLPGETEAPRDLDLELDLEIGDEISGSEATATAEGLEEGADYDIVVRSTPQTLAVGTVPTGGVVTRTVTLPTLEAGWHSLTFTSTWAGGGAAIARVWFQVSSTGTLLAVSRTAPNLANTGASDPGANLWMPITALVAGLGLVVLRRRTVKVTAAK